MDFAYFKFLRYFNHHSVSKSSVLCDVFNLTINEANEIVFVLHKNGYLYFTDNSYKTTYKGKHFIKSAILSFINVNIIDILALIVSSFALIVSIIALVLK